MNRPLSFKVLTLLVGLTFPGLPTAQGQDDFFKSFDIPRKASPDSNGDTGGGNPAQKGEADIEPPPAVMDQAEEILTSGESHPSLVLDDYPPLMTLEEYESYRKKRSEFRRIVASGVADAAAREKMNTGIKTLLHGLTIKEFQSSVDANAALKSVFRDAIFNAGEEITQTVAKRQFREEFFEALMPTLKELLQHNYFVRLRASIILGNMDLVSGKLKEGVEPVPYRPAAELALELLASEDQPEAVKIQAARCVEKSLKYGDFFSNTRSKAALTCVDQLLNHSRTWWYQNALIDCLVASELEVHEGKPFIIQALAQILSDPTQDKLARSHAAFALGRVPMSSKLQLNLHLLCHEILSLSVSMAEDRNNLIKSFHGNPPDQFISRWALSFQGTYLAYQPTNILERNLGFGLVQRISKPGMGADADIVKESYARVYKFYDHCMRIDNIKRPFPEALISSGKDWLDEYPPDDFRVSPQTQPLVGAAEPEPSTNSEVTVR